MYLSPGPQMKCNSVGCGNTLKCIYYTRDLADQCVKDCAYRFGDLWWSIGGLYLYNERIMCKNKGIKVGSDGVVLEK